MNPVTATNATKGLLATGAEILITGLDVFGLVDLNEAQTAWVYGAVAFAGALWIAATHRLSRKRADSY